MELNLFEQIFKLIKKYDKESITYKSTLINYQKKMSVDEIEDIICEEIYEVNHLILELECIKDRLNISLNCLNSK